MSLEIIPIPLKELPMGDMLTGHSSASVATFLSEARQESSSTRHMIINGDATDALHLLPDESTDLIVTSIPYESLVEYGSGDNRELAAAELGNESSPESHKAALCTQLTVLKDKMKNDASLIIPIGNPRVGGRGESGPNGIKSKKRRKGMLWKKGKAKSLIRLTDLLADAAESVGLLLRSVEIWKKPYCKPETVQDRSRQVHEYVMIFQKTEASKCVRSRLTAAGIPSDDSVFTCPITQATYDHPATFNPLLAERYIVAMSEPSDVVLDFMGGVGSTSLAAIKNARSSITIELYPENCQTALNRLSHFAKDFKSKVYEPARYDIFDEAACTTPVEVKGSDDFRPKASDVRYMYNFRAVPKPELLKDILPASDPQTIDPFPVECLTGFQRDLLDDLVLASEANEATAATCILTTWSAAISGGWEAFDRKKSATDYPNLQSMVVMPSGTGKSVAVKTSKPISYFNRVYARYAQLQRLKSEPSLTSDSATGPALIEQLIESQEKTFLFSPEAGGLLADIIAGARGGGGNLFDLLLKGFSVEETTYRTKKDGRQQCRPNIAMLLLAQPDLVKEFMENKQFKARGLANRWLLVETPEPPSAYDDGRSYDSHSRVHRVWHDQIRQALYHRILGHERIQRHTWTDAAIEVFRARHNRIVERIGKDWKPFETLLRRSREIHKRISLGLLAAEYYSGNIDVLTDDEDVAIRAGVIMDWFDQRRIDYFSISLQETLNERKLRVVSILLECSERRMTLRDMERRHMLKAEQLKELATAYSKLFEIKSIKPKGAGRPSRVIRLKWVA